MEVVLDRYKGNLIKIHKDLTEPPFHHIPFFTWSAAFAIGSHCLAGSYYPLFALTLPFMREVPLVNLTVVLSVFSHANLNVLDAASMTSMIGGILMVIYEKKPQVLGGILQQGDFWERLGTMKNFFLSPKNLKSINPGVAKNT